MRPQRGRRHPGLIALAVVALIGLSLSGCRAFTTPSLRKLPFWQRFGNPWGVEANARRKANPASAGRFTSEMARWAQFGRDKIASGDILLRRGTTCLIPVLDVSHFIAGAADSPFSHAGIACREGDRVWVYDVESSGVHKVPFEYWMLDVYHGVFAVKRLREPYRDRIPQALAFCEAVYRAQVPFDYSLRLDDCALYCSEMVSKAYASAGLHLSDPVPLCCLPNYDRYRCLAAVLQKVTNIRMTEPVFVTGNASYGLYGSALLETAYESAAATQPKRSANNPPRCAAASVH